MTPELGLTTEAIVERVVDGDTIEVRIERKFKIRLKDLLVAESNTKEGTAAKKFLQETLRKDDRVVVFIPTHNPTKLMDINSFDRLIGQVWQDGRNISDEVVEGGFGRYIKVGEKPREGI